MKKKLKAFALCFFVFLISASFVIPCFGSVYTRSSGGGKYYPLFMPSVEVWCGDKDYVFDFSGSSVPLGDSSFTVSLRYSDSLAYYYGIDASLYSAFADTCDTFFDGLPGGLRVDVPFLMYGASDSWVSNWNIEYFYIDYNSSSDIKIYSFFQGDRSLIFDSQSPRDFRFANRDLSQFNLDSSLADYSGLDYSIRSLFFDWLFGAELRAYRDQIDCTFYSACSYSGIDGQLSTTFGFSLSGFGLVPEPGKTCQVYYSGRSVVSGAESARFYKYSTVGLDFGRYGRTSHTLYVDNCLAFAAGSLIDLGDGYSNYRQYHIPDIKVSALDQIVSSNFLFRDWTGANVIYNNPTQDKLGEVNSYEYVVLEQRGSYVYNFPISPSGYGNMSFRTPFIGDLDLRFKEILTLDYNRLDTMSYDSSLPWGIISGKIEGFQLVDFLDDVTSIFFVDIFGFFSIADILSVAVGLTLFFVILKLFLGG